MKHDPERPQPVLPAVEARAGIAGPGVVEGIAERKTHLPGTLLQPREVLD